jgi:glutamate synthase (NADPH/NADH) large chain
MVDLEALDQSADIQLVGELIERHVTHTSSAWAAKVLAGWRAMQTRFVKIMPRDFKRIQAAETRARAEGREPTFGELVGAAGG